MNRIYNLSISSFSELRWIWQTLAFSALAILVVGVAVLPGNPYRLRHQAFLETMRRDARDGYPVEVFLLGDSRMQALASVALPDGWLSLAWAADAPEEMYLKLGHALEQHAGVRTVLLQVDHHKLLGEAFSVNRKWMTRFAAMDDYRAMYRMGLYEYAKTVLVDRVPLLDQDVYLTRRQQWVARWLPFPYPAWAEMSPRLKQERAQSRMRQLLGGSFSARRVRLYADIIGRCRARGINVYGVLSPLSPECIDVLNTLDVWQVRAAIDSLELDAVWDHTSLLLNHDYFADQDHVNAAGAKRWVMELQRESRVVH